jgi:hypothetical protein
LAGSGTRDVLNGEKANGKKGGESASERRADAEVIRKLLWPKVWGFLDRLWAIPTFDEA